MACSAGRNATPLMFMLLTDARSRYVNLLFFLPLFLFPFRHLDQLGYTWLTLSGG